MFKITNYTDIDGISSLLEFTAKQLGISDAEVVITKNDKLLDRFSTREYRVNGLLHKSSAPGIYNLILREHPSEPLNLILCHEMIHLGQYIKGQLSLDMDNKVFTWKGQSYASDYPYESRPWEMEAFNGQGKLLKKFRKFQNGK